MRRITLLAAALLALTAGSASAATVPVTSLSGDFAATNPSVGRHSDGVQFGPYADGGRAGGSLFYSGFNGRTLGEITALAYTAELNTTDDSPVAAPYLRIFLEGDTHDVIFSPNTQPAPNIAENTLVTHDVFAGTVRYDDDVGAGSDQPFADIQAVHASEIVSGIYVTAGFSGGIDLSTRQTNLTVNTETFCFNCESAPVGGSSGGSGSFEPPAIIPVVVTAPNALPVGVAPKCDGDDMRVLRAPRREGARFLSARATLRGRALGVSGRRIRVDLRGRPEGNYNVRITSRYRKAGKVRTVRTHRNRSVVCA